MRLRQKKKAVAELLKDEHDSAASELAMDSCEPEDLTEEYRKKCERIKDHGVGICSECR